MKASELLRILELLVGEATKNLNEYEEFEERRVAPDEHTPMKLQSSYISIWCSAKCLFDYLNAKSYAGVLSEVPLKVMMPQVLVGLLQAANRDFANGLILHPRIIATADSMADILEQAEHLLDNGYKDAACVLVGGALESILRGMVENIEGETVKDTLKKLNERLHKVSAYDKVTFRQIEAWTDLRNAAAHGDYGQVAKEAVADFLSFTRKFITSFYAPKFSMT